MRKEGRESDMEAKPYATTRYAMQRTTGQVQVCMGMLDGGISSAGSQEPHLMQHH